MPLIYIHGVAVRDESAWKQREPFLRHYVTPIINPNNPESVEILPVFWGSDGVAFAWDGESRPRTALLGQGFDTDPSSAERAVLLASLGNSLGKLPASPTTAVTAPAGDLLAAGPTAPSTPATKPQRLRDLTDDQLSDFLVSLIAQQSPDPAQQARMSIAADEVARDPATKPKLQACASAAEEVALVQSLIRQHYEQMTPAADGGLVGMGASWFPDLKDRMSELLDRANQTPGFVVSRLLGELRPVINSGVTLFIGDVFVYLANRLAKPIAAGAGGSAIPQPGIIPMQLLTALRQARTLQQKAEADGQDEPIVVLTHSMGGQIMYDTATTFLPQLPDYQDIRVDFWCATASQVGLFEEMKLFLASSPAYSKAKGNKAPFPDRRYLGGWWNMWDVNDIISFTAASIFDGVDDEFYDSGSSLLNAHSGYLERPSFYRAFADKLRASHDKNWYRP